MNFVEITSNDNWFKQHPEKIAGVEYETTSFHFPIQVKGTKDDVLRVTGMTASGKYNKGTNVVWEGQTVPIMTVVEIGNELKYQLDLGKGKSIWTTAETLDKENKTVDNKKLAIAKAKAKALKLKLLLK